MNAQIKVVGGLELVRRDLSKLLSKKGSLEDIYEFIVWAETVFAEAKTEISNAIGNQTFIGISPDL